MTGRGEGPCCCDGRWRFLALLGCKPVGQALDHPDLPLSRYVWRAWQLRVRKGCGQLQGACGPCPSGPVHPFSPLPLINRELMQGVLFMEGPEKPKNPRREAKAWGQGDLGSGQGLLPAARCPGAGKSCGNFVGVEDVPAPSAPPGPSGQGGGVHVLLCTSLYIRCPVPSKAPAGPRASSVSGHGPHEKVTNQKDPLPGGGGAESTRSPGDPTLWSPPQVPQSLSAMRPSRDPCALGWVAARGWGCSPEQLRDGAEPSEHLGANTPATPATGGRGCGPPATPPLPLPAPPLPPRGPPPSSRRCRARPGAGPCAPCSGTATGRCCRWPPSCGAWALRAGGLFGAGTRRPTARWGRSAWCACPGTRSRLLPPRPSARWAAPADAGLGGGDRGGERRTSARGDSGALPRRCPA